MATAESLTGGLIAAMLTSVPGSSASVRGGIVSYVNEVKAELLGVSEDVLARQGAVDELVALQMARGALRELGSDVSVAVTGIAGPTGAEPASRWARCGSAAPRPKRPMQHAIISKAAARPCACRRC